jgi:hypothetical protein
MNWVRCVQDDGREVQLPPQERVAAVRPFWETLTQEQRVALLSIDLEELRGRAKDVAARQRRQAGARGWPPLSSSCAHDCPPFSSCARDPTPSSHSSCARDCLPLASSCARGCPSGFLLCA